MSKLTNKDRIAAGHKPVGRPPMSKSGPRPRYWVLVSYSEKTTLVMSAGQDAEPTVRGTYSKEEASADFESKIGCQPDEIKGPFYYQMGNQKEEQNQDLVDVDFSSLEYDNSYPASYGNWEGLAMKIKNRNDIVAFSAQKTTDGSKKNPPPLCAIKAASVKPLGKK